jgi:hypothetical protein
VGQGGLAKDTGRRVDKISKTLSQSTCLNHAGGSESRARSKQSQALHVSGSSACGDGVGASDAG